MCFTHILLSAVVAAGFDSVPGLLNCTNCFYGQLGGCATDGQYLPQGEEYYCQTAQIIKDWSEENGGGYCSWIWGEFVTSPQDQWQISSDQSAIMVTEIFPPLEILEPTAAFEGSGVVANGYCAGYIMMEQLGWPRYDIHAPGYNRFAYPTALLLTTADHMGSVDPDTGMANIDVWHQRDHCWHRQFGVDQNWGARFQQKVVKCEDIPDWVKNQTWSGSEHAGDDARIPAESGGMGKTVCNHLWEEYEKLDNLIPKSLFEGLERETLGQVKVGKLCDTTGREGQMCPAMRLNCEQNGEWYLNPNGLGCEQGSQCLSGFCGTDHKCADPPAYTLEAGHCMATEDCNEGCTCAFEGLRRKLLFGEHPQGKCICQ